MSRAGGSEQLEVAIEGFSMPDASGAPRQILAKIAFCLRRGEVAALVGPSGCGKTSLLRLLAGLAHGQAGHISRPSNAKLGFVFQEPRLLPWRNVETNVRLAAPNVGEADLASIFSALGLSEHRHDFPSSLSLGLARRVAIARAFAIAPDVLFLDEPFVSLDAVLASRLRQELLALIESRGVTSLIVTHDLDEAMALADTVLVLSDRPASLLADIPIPLARRERSVSALAPIRADIVSRLSAQ